MKIDVFGAPAPTLQAPEEASALALDDSGEIFTTGLTISDVTSKRRPATPLGPFILDLQ